MSAQLYLSRLVDEGRADRALHRASLRTGGLYPARAAACAAPSRTASTDPRLIGAAPPRDCRRPQPPSGPAVGRSSPGDRPATDPEPIGLGVRRVRGKGPAPPTQVAQAGPFKGPGVSHWAVPARGRLTPWQPSSGPRDPPQHRPPPDRRAPLEGDQQPRWRRLHRPGRGPRLHARRAAARRAGRLRCRRPRLHHRQAGAVRDLPGARRGPQGARRAGLAHGAAQGDPRRDLPRGRGRRRGPRDPAAHPPADPGPALHRRPDRRPSASPVAYVEGQVTPMPVLGPGADPAGVEHHPLRRVSHL